MTEETEKRVLELAALLCDELITDEQFAELDVILASDGGARDAYCGFLALHQRLQNGALEASRTAAIPNPVTAIPEPDGGGAFKAVGTAPDLKVLGPAHPGGRLEGRVRKAERRAKWSMVACLVVSLFLIALLFRPRTSPSAKLLPPDSPGSPPATTTFPSDGRHSDGSSWEDLSLAGGVFDGTIALDRLANRKGPSLLGSVALNEVSPETVPGELLSRESYGALSADLVPLSSGEARPGRRGGQFKDLGTSGLKPDRSLAGGSFPDNNGAGQSNHAGTGQAAPVRPVDLRSGDGDEFAGVLGRLNSPETQLGETSRDLVELRFRADSSDENFRPMITNAGDVLPPKGSGGDSESVSRTSPDKNWDRASQEEDSPAGDDGPELATLSLIDRVPLITTTIREAEVSKRVTEEVRYSIDSKDPVGDPATSREIGLTLGVTANSLPDGSIRMKMRPRSAQDVEEIIGPSGKRYPQVSESMREGSARVPEGHSLVLGGFYGEVKTKDDDKAPLLGDQPRIGFYFKSKEAARERSSLLFVATPTVVNDRVEIETKVLSVNDGFGGRAGADWTSSLGDAGVPSESIRSLNSLLGTEGAGGGADGAIDASDSPIVLSPTQIEGVLSALSTGGLVTQASNPTLIVKDSGQDAISQAEREQRALQEVEKTAATEPYSTFSLNVSDVSFKLAKAALARGEWPGADQVRVEEFVNAFDYGDPAPSQAEKVACNLEQAAHPFLQQRNLLRVSMSTAALGRSAATPLRLTVLLDRSGSMERADRADSVRSAFRLLAHQLNPQDQVTLIGFARTPRLLADRVPGNRVAELVNVVDATPSEGGTNIEQALRLAMDKAKEQKLEGGQNRIILLTDGAVNLGNARPEDLARLVESMRQQKIAFDACGVGADGLNDEILESLTRKGDGRYYFLDRPEDADAGFARQIAGALRPAARNVKVQVIFNPNRVGRYKLYGFEKHRLKKEDFRNDSVDAAELAGEEAGNAIYQVEFLPEGSGEIGTVSVRFQDTESGRMIEREWTIPYEVQVPRLEDSAASLRLASGAALLGEKLKGSRIGESVEMTRLMKLMHSLPGDFPSDQRVHELVQMAAKVREMGGE